MRSGGPARGPTADSGWYTAFGLYFGGARPYSDDPSAAISSSACLIAMMVDMR